MTATSIGVDPSLSNLAVCIVNGREPLEKSFGSKCPELKTLGSRVARYRAMVNAIVEWLSQKAATGTVFIEGYSFGSKATFAHQAGEFGMYLRCALLLKGYTVVEVPPAKLKQFASGKGNGKKAAIVSALAKRYGREFAHDDAADAFALAKLGANVLNIEPPDTAFQAKAAGEVKKLYEAELGSKPW